MNIFTITNLAGNEYSLFEPSRLNHEYSLYIVHLYCTHQMSNVLNNKISSTRHNSLNAGNSFFYQIPSLKRPCYNVHHQNVLITHLSAGFQVSLGQVSSQHGIPQSGQMSGQTATCHIMVNHITWCHLPSTVR